VHAGIWWGNLNETDHLEDLAIDGITILRGIFQEIGLEGGIDWTLLTQDRQVAHCYECSGEPSGSIRGGIFCTS